MSPCKDHIQLPSVSDRLKQRGFEATVHASGTQAAQAIIHCIQPGSTVGIGGSVTIQTLDISKQLREKGCTVFWHWEADNPKAARDAAFCADHYLLSANALGQDGVIYNIDGTGNRVAATLFGPAKIWMIVGKNKVVSGGYAKAIERMQQAAAPLNARRLGLQTPCAVTGRCNDCTSTQRMCSGIVALQKRPSAKPFFHVMLVEQDLGY